MAAPKLTIFFLAGLYHNAPWFFDGIRSILSARGYATETTSHVSGGRSVTVANEGMLSDARHVRSVLTKLIDEGKEIVFVVHSYGGLVVSNAVEGLSVQQRAAEGKQGGVLMIMFLSALALPAGKSIMSLGDATAQPWEYTADNYIVPKDPAQNFYGDVEHSLAVKAVSSLTPMSSQVLVEESTYEPWNQGFEVGYIFTENDKSIPISLQKQMFAQFPSGCFSASLATGHSPFLNAPDALSDAIQSGIEHVSQKRHLSLQQV
ncbi:hypothetical protein F4678DRAFT_313690 [Xylaria arbuscula]|nr:hypothetical protein F4678DRAFT_313690 [Xylaria arbuscula]